MTDVSPHSLDGTDDAANSRQTAPNPNGCRLLTDGGEAQTEERDGDTEGDSEDTAASNGQSESAEESTDEAESESTEETAEADEADQSEGTAEAGSADDAEAEGDEEGTTVLFLDLEGLFLDVLGLEVDLNEVKLDVSAVSGPGNLLGNLLDAVSGLLGSGDSGLLMDLIGGSLFEGIAADEDGEGGLLGGDDEGEDGEDGEGRLTAAAGSAKESLSEAFEGVPFDEILTSVLKELVEQMFDSSDGSEESGSGSDA